MSLEDWRRASQDPQRPYMQTLSQTGNSGYCSRLQLVNVVINIKSINAKLVRNQHQRVCMTDENVLEICMVDAWCYPAFI